MTNPFERPATPASFSYEKVSLQTPEILAALTAAPIYEKYGDYQAREAVPGVEVETRLKDGQFETSYKQTHAGDMVVTQPTGEVYVVGVDEFSHRYDPTETEGVFSAKGLAKAIQNPFHKPISIDTPWGSIQNGDSECMVLLLCDADGNTHGEPYINDGESFAATYRLHTKS